ncbi:cellulose synthase BcsB [Plautia stali symbiont]|nr:cellulose synthase BcsB [Plautia stali symbiont]
MKTLTYTLLASALTTTLLLAPAWAETPAVTQDSAALSDVPSPQGLDGSADPQLKQAAGDAPYTPGDAAPVQENTAPAQPAESAQSAAPAASDIVISQVAAEAPAAAEPAGALLNQPVSSTISVAQMGQPRGITLTGGQLQSGILFTLPGDEVITNARLNLSLRVSAALAARNTSLQLMLNGQPLGTLPLGASDSDVSDYQLDIPAAMVVSSNNLSFKINDADKLLCEKESAQQYQVTILPKTTLSLEGQQLNIGTSLRNFPRPFIDVQRMTPASVTFGFATNVSPDSVSAAALVASWLGIQSDYRGIRFPVVRGDLPEHNGILIGHPGDKIGSVTAARGQWPAAAGDR